MDSRRIEQIKKQFDDAIQVIEDERIEFWYARDLMELLGYSRWENFEKAIGRAIESCETTQIESLDHFRKVTKMVPIGSKAYREVDDDGFARIRSRGDHALFGGHSTKDMKVKLGVKDNRPLADFLPTLTIAAKNLATEMTNYNVESKNLYGEPAITGEHVQNNAEIRKMLGERGIKPEELPPAEDIKKLERRTKSQDKKIIEKSGSFANIEECSK